MQSPGSNTSTQPRPHLPVWQGLGVCRHPGRAPCGSPDQQAGQPGVPGGGGWSRQPGQFREVALCFSEACPKKLCESPTSHSYGRGDEARGSEALTQPSNCTWLCLLPVPSSLPHSWGKQHQEEKREETGGGVTPFPHLLQSCTCAPPTLPPVAQLSEQGESGSQFQATKPGEAHGVGRPEIDRILHHGPSIV